MRPYPERFKTILNQALYRIKANTGKNLAVVQDEIGYAMNREGESYLRYLRKGNIPGHVADIERLAEELTARQGLDESTADSFLRSAGHPRPEQVLAMLFPSRQGSSPIISSRDSSSVVHDRAFIVGPPVTEPRSFYGRAQELHHIFNWIGRFPMTHGAIIGPRRAGKTSLLHYVRSITSASTEALRPKQKQDWLVDKPPYRWIWIDFQDVRMRRQEGVLRHILACLDLPQPDPCTLDLFMDMMADYDWSSPVVVLIDELSAGLQAPDLNLDFWWSLRSLLNTNTAGHIAFVVAAHEQPMTLAAAENKTSPFFNMFNSLALGPMSVVEARDLIASSPIPFLPADIEWILNQSGCWPCLVQIFCQARLLALELEEDGDGWKLSAMAQIEPYRYLLEAR